MFSCLQSTAVSRTRTVLLALLLSLMMPGLGIVASGSIMRGITWFILLTLCSVYDGYSLFTVSSICTIYALYTFVVCASVLWLAMMLDTWACARHTHLRAPWVSVGIAFCYATMSFLILCVKCDSPIEYAVIEGTGSMTPTLRGDTIFVLKDRVLWNKNAYRFENPHIGDIVCVLASTYNGNDRSLQIKRIVALPHDTIQLVSGLLLINGIPHTIATNALVHTPDFIASQSTLPLGSNEYFVIGDNLATSYDSRYYGPVHRSNILGKVNAIIWPPWRSRML